MDSEKDKNVKRIARFLELGGTMLADQCNTCGAPKFRYQGRVICPLCDVREEGEANVEEVRNVGAGVVEEIGKERGVEEVEKVEKMPVSPADVPVSKTGLGTEKEMPGFEAKRAASENRQRAWFEPPLTPETGVQLDTFSKTQDELPPKTPAVPRKSAEELRFERAGPLLDEAKKIDVSSFTESRKARELLEDLLLRKLVNIADSLQQENDPRRVEEDFELIEKGLTLIEHLKHI